VIDRCADIDLFFDHELDADQAAAFRDHLPGCARCQSVLDGRMQEFMAVQPPAIEPVLRPLPLPRPLAQPLPRRLPEPLPQVVAESLPRVAAPPAPSPAAIAQAIPPPAQPVVRSRPPANGNRRLVLYMAPALAAAAALALWISVRNRRGDAGLEVESTIAAADGARPRATSHVRAADAHAPLSADPKQPTDAALNSVLHTTARGDGRTILVYLDDRELRLACPGNDRNLGKCRRAAGAVMLELPLTVRGHYAVVTLERDELSEAKRITFDELIAAARSAGIARDVGYIQVK
jgi:hypothetical protein